MTRRLRTPLTWLILGLLTLCSLAWALRPGEWQPSRHAGLMTQTIQAYRQWQSTGIKLEAGDYVTVRASGEWQYSPLVGLHGPAGGLPAVSSYPMPSARGGALLGRIGESGERFYVGPRYTGHVRAPGMLYLRINDDLLGDNQGKLDVTIDVIRATATPRP
jgi:hypothetical protein